jgi:exodeoxyribonuclease V beta subunit
MCGPDTPVLDGHASGVFDWAPPAALIVGLSDLLDAGRAAA